MRKKRDIYNFMLEALLCLTLAAGLTVICGRTGWASDTPQEDGIPKFTQEGEKIVAKLIPRAKSTYVRIAFGASGGRLASMKAKPFREADRPELDEKDFKSGLYVIHLDNLGEGDTSTVTLSSDFFSSSTEYWIFNPGGDVAWTKADAKNEGRANRMRDIILTVKDGGPLDADNSADGHITLIGGPKDSFWGYALGTLFIRFFGIFLVLSILMIGMNLSGKIFEKLEGPEAKKGGPPESDPEATSSQDAGGNNDGGQATDSESAAVAAAAVHVFLSRTRAPMLLELAPHGVTAWIQHGRERAMGAYRFSARNR